jgi:hypothetical protein
MGTYLGQRGRLICWLVTFSLWGYTKSNVYTHRPQNIAELKLKMREEIAGVPVEK